MAKAKGLNIDVGGIWSQVRDALRDKGIDLDACCDVELGCEGEDSPRVKVVCVAPGLKDTVEEMSKAPRDQVVMVRVDEATSRDLDAWVETGAVKSRSEAAALFIREGLNVRAKELEQLREALGDVEKARERLRERAREVFGDEAE